MDENSIWFPGGVAGLNLLMTQLLGVYQRYEDFLTLVSPPQYAELMQYVRTPVRDLYGNLIGRIEPVIRNRRVVSVRFLSYQSQRHQLPAPKVDLPRLQLVRGND